MVSGEAKAAQSARLKEGYQRKLPGLPYVPPETSRISTTPQDTIVFTNAEDSSSVKPRL